MNNIQKIKTIKNFETKVIIIILTTTLVTSVSIFAVVYYQIQNMILTDLQEHATVINKYAAEITSIESFESINTIEDEASECYIEIQEELNTIRKIANIRYLYTAKYNENKECVYVIDGLDYGVEDFRHPGMLIEEEIIPDLERCLQGEAVISDEFLNTEWGMILVTYWPVYRGNEVVGAIGMEFDVENLYQSYNHIRFYTFVIALFIIAVVSFIAVLLWKMLFDPVYKKMAYVDYLTEVGNRTSYELEIKEIEENLSQYENVALIIFDLNNLKRANDLYGHTTGDKYIKMAAECIVKCFGTLGSCYRIGGDEFAVIIKNQSYDYLMEKLNKEFYNIQDSIKSNSSEPWIQYFGIACGLAEYRKDIDKSLHDTYGRADKQMYECKKKMKTKDVEGKNNSEI